MIDNLIENNPIVMFQSFFKMLKKFSDKQTNLSYIYIYISKLRFVFIFKRSFFF